MSESQIDWVSWHKPYEDPESPLSQRLRVVQGSIERALDAAPDGPIRAISFCSGEGRDLIGVLVGHPRSKDVVARLVEADPRNADIARDTAAQAGLHGIEVVTGDAGVSSAYEGAVPADLVLVCGVFGNISDADVARTVAHLPQFCAPAATVVWTRHRRSPDLTVEIRRWFTDNGFEEVAFDSSSASLWGVGTQRFLGKPVPLERDVKLFTFLR